MKNWKQLKVMAIIAIFGIVIGFTACDNGNGTPQKQDPVVDDFNINGTGTFDYDGTAKTVTITPKPDKSKGTITVYYNGSVTVPIEVNTYSVTFDVAEAEGFNAAAGLSAGTLIIDTSTRPQDFIIGGNDEVVEFTLEYHKTDTTSAEKIQGAVDLFQSNFDLGSSTHKTTINNLVNGEGGYKIVVDYNDNFDGFVATSTKTIKVSKAWLDTNPTFTGNTLRTAFNAMLAYEE